jgi:predicted GNAT family N-acyltransferase
MAKYEISHPELPQVRGILELKDGEEPSDQHFWEAAKTMVRPYGASQLSNEAKISAYKNGFFDTPSGPILDVDDDPETIQDEESPGLLSTLVDYAQDMGRKADPFISPYRKVLSLKDEAVPYENTENLDQFREAGKILFGLLDNREMSIQGDPISEALKQTGMPFYQKNKDARGRVKAAAMDYASDNIKSSVGMGTARAWKTPEFLLRGGAALSNYLTLDEEDDGEVLSYVNSLIGFDKVNYEYETAAEFAAWVMDNPVDALKGTVGIEPESMTFDSPLEQDLRSGFQVPSEGIGLLAEVVGDPLNAAGGTLAKGVTAPMRIGLKGRMLKTIQDVQQKTIQLAKYQNTLQKLPTDIANKSLQALIRSRITKESAKLADELAEQQKVLQKYGSNSLHLRLMGKASPETLGKVAMETFDQSTDAGKMGMGLVQEAIKATDKMSKLRRVANTAAKLNPEIAGASVGALVAGPIGAAVGASLPTIAKIGRFLSSMTENSAIRYIINADRQAGREVTIESARQRYKNFKNLSGTALGLGSAAGFSFDQDALGGGAAIAALATFIGPKALSLYDNIARDARVVGSELTLARTGDHTPFFRRLSMLPTPDQGLAGATMDKFNILMKPSPEGLASRLKDAIAQGSRASAKEVNPSAQPFRVGPGGEKIGQAPTISNATQKVANFLDNAGAVGRLGTPLETLGRFGKGMAAGASLPATIGFVASAGQPSGAVAGAIMSAPFTALGAGAGMYENYKTKGDLYSKQIGDIQYYREHLTKSEQAEFDAMPAHIRTQVAGYSLSHPDVVFKQTTEGEGGFNPVTMEVSYNPNGSGYLKGTLAHELTHFMEVHGLTPMVNRILFGDKETKTAGEFASYDKDGNIVYTDEFIGYTDKDGNYVEGLRDIYMDRLRKDASLDPEAVAAYESDPTKIGREIFADQGADFLLTGKREKALNQGPAGKAIQATIDGITGVSFLRDFLLKLNQPLNADGKFITSTDLFKGKLRKIPELQNLIEKYYKDVRGLKKAEIEGSEFTDPNTGKTRKTEGKKPIDDEFETLYTVEDQKNPNVVDKLNTGGIYKTNPQTGEIEKDALGNPIRMTGTEANKVSEAAGDHAADVLQKNGIDVEINDKGRPFAKDLPALSEAVIDQLAKGPIHPRQIAALREISRALRQGDGERAGMLIGYYSATQGRKPKAVPFAVRTTMPYGFELTAQGNILVRIHDVGQIQKNLEFLKGERQPKKLPDDLIGMYDELFGTDNAVWDAFSLYRQNTANGIDGRTGLDADPVIANKKLNFLNALHGGITKSQVAMNPVLDAIGYNMAAINKKHNPFGPATKTFRLDRVFNAERSGKASPVNEQRVINLMSPEAQKLYTPAFHGTPHTLAPEAGAPLGRFRTSKIGTGEGAQAYGYGLYFAGRREVAEHYRKVLTDDKNPSKSLYDGQPYDPYNKKHNASIRLKRAGGDRSRAIKSLQDSIYLEKAPNPSSSKDPFLLKQLEETLEVIKKKQEAKVNEGSLYKVELAPKDSEYLLWDKPLSEQPKGVREKIDPIIKKYGVNTTFRGKGNTDSTHPKFWKDIEAKGDVIYGELAGKLGSKPESSAALKEAGIPGIKYLDGMSRGKGEGDYNYVIFDEADVTVTEKLFMPASGKRVDQIKAKYPSVKLDIYGDAKKGFELSRIVVPKDERSSGLGTAVMDDIIKMADDQGATISLTPDMSFGGSSVSRLKEFYKKFGFVENKGRNKDFSTRNTMIRPASDKLFMPASEAGATKGKPTQGDTTPASVQSWDGPNPTFGTNFTRGMVKDNKEAAALLRKSYEDQFGEPLRAQDFTEEQVNWLGDMLAKEGEAALGRTGNAVNWYTSAVERALSVAEEIFPDIGQKYEAKDRFLGALSITSQNMRVMDNAKGAVKQYQHKERTGKFDYSIKHGAKADAITQNLKLYDQAEAKMGVKDLHEFLDTDFTVKELSQWGKSFFGNKKFSIAGYNTDMVKGSAIFGPKIGQGFFQNLRGNYNPVTVDLWLRRTFGRLTGLALDTELKAGDIGRLIYSVRKNVGKRKFSGLELPEFLKGVSISGKVQGNGVANFKISDQAFNRLFGDNTIGRDNFEAVYDFAGKLNKEWERRFATAGNDVTKAKKAIKAVRKEKKSTTNLEKKLAKLEVEKEAIGKEKPQWAKAGSTVFDKLKPIDIPSNAERAVITKSFNVALKTLRDKGIDLTPADLQATLWYPEKDIWAFLKGENSDALNMSYDTAMEVIRDQR